MIHKYDKDNIVNWGKLHMFSKQTCICLTYSTQTVETVGHLRKRSHNRLLPRLCSKVKKCVSPQLTQRLVSLSSPLVPKVWVESQTRVANG